MQKITVNTCGLSTIVSCCLLVSLQVSAEPISPNGYSGLGIVPSSKTIDAGGVSINFDPTVPGASRTRGYNTQIGFGLTDNLELVGKLATNDHKCNMFTSGACPSNTYRDFSSALKWSIPIDWLKQNKSAVAVGVTDFGGAATYFRSYYLVGTKSVGDFDVSLGQAKAKAPNAMLDGPMASFTWKPSESFNASVQKVGSSTTAHAVVKKQILSDGSEAWVTLNHRISRRAYYDFEDCSANESRLSIAPFSRSSHLFVVELR